MDLGLKGKTALVLGAGGGLGSAIAATLAAEPALSLSLLLNRGQAGILESAPLPEPVERLVERVVH